MQIVTTAHTDVEDVAIFSRDALDESYAVNFDKPWLAEEPSGRITEFDTEDAACDFQREWRPRNGLDAMTGEVNAQTT